MPAYPSVSAVDGPIDCALIAIPGSAVEQAVEECAAKGVRSAVILSAGFAETGSEGKRSQDRLTAIARSSGMRIVGPNCMGLFNIATDFYCTFGAAFDDPVRGWPRSGGIGIVSQSGGVGIHLYMLARDRGLGFSKWLTTGNECDIEYAECVAALAEDEATRVILVYAEGCRDPAMLVDALEAARAKRKPVIVLKVGRSDVGAEAVISHTATLAGSDKAFDALLIQHGAFRVRTVEELIDIAVACDHGRFPATSEIGLVSISGGIGVLMADAASEFGVEVPALPAKAQRRLKELVPYAPVRNPVDTTAQWANNVPLIGKNMEIMIEDGDCRSMVVFVSTLGVTEDRLEIFRKDLRAIRKRYPDRLFAVSIIASPENCTEIERDGFLVYRDPSRAVEAISALFRIGAAWSHAAHRQRIPRSTPRLPDGPIGEVDALDLLEQAGLPVVPRRLARSAAETARAAAELGFPTVVKIVSPDISHKTEIGGVMLGITSRRRAGEAYRALMRRARNKAPGARIDGVVVAPQVEGGVETFIGAYRDPSLGPMVMFGIGGIFVELLDDVAVRLAPIGPREARAMIKEIKGYPLLEGARGSAPADIPVLARALSRLSVLAAANADRLQSIDINPFIVLPRGQGAVAVDALVVPTDGSELA